MELATHQDVDEIFEVVKAAYTVEFGNSGFAFKNVNRYTSSKAVIEDLHSIWVLRDNGNSKHELMIGCVKAVVNTHTQIVEIGPVATRPEYQGKGYGTKMLDFVETLAPIQEVGVVSCRTDVVPIYEKRGYIVVKKDPVIDHIPLRLLTRTDLEYVIMIKNNSNLPIPTETDFINFAKKSREVNYKSYDN